MTFWQIPQRTRYKPSRRFSAIVGTAKILALFLLTSLDAGRAEAQLYVSPTGNDVNSGKQDAAKLTLLGALTSLPGGDAATRTAGRGTVYVSPGSGSRIWLMAPSDPNYSNPPAGWLRCNGCTLNIIGAGNYASGPNPHKNRVLAGGGIRLSGTQQPIHIANFGFEYPQRGIVIGECSNGDRSGKCGVSGVVLENVTATTWGQPNSGPCTDITGASFWIWLRDYGCTGNSTAATGGRFSNNAAAILVDGTGNPGNGVSIVDTNLSGGGIKFIPGKNGGWLYVNTLTVEGREPCSVYFSDFNSFTQAVLIGISTADPMEPTPPVCNMGGQPGPMIIGTSGGVISTGPATVLGIDSNTFINQSVSPLQHGQIGFFNGYVVGQTDVARRIAGLVPVRFKNLATSNAAAWSSTHFSSDVVLTIGQADPFGGPYATKATSTGSLDEALYLTGRCDQIHYTPNAGDWIVGGAWVKGDGSTPSRNVGLTFCGYTSPTFSLQQTHGGMLKGDGQYQWEWFAYKVSGGSPVTIGMAARFSLGNSVTAYGPVLYIIPSGTLSDNEVLEFASTMTSVDSACPIGSICNMPGHPLVTK